VLDGNTALVDEETVIAPSGVYNLPTIVAELPIEIAALDISVPIKVRFVRVVTAPLHKMKMFSALACPNKLKLQPPPNARAAVIRITQVVVADPLKIILLFIVQAPFT
jgi:hypothetical protein